MDLHELPFAKIIILRDDIAEVMINDGVRMNQEMVEQYHDFLLSHLRAPFSLLVNKINSYTYDFHAQEKLATLKEINAMAVVTFRPATRKPGNTTEDNHGEDCCTTNQQPDSDVLMMGVYRWAHFGLADAQACCQGR